jgi:undecaprenyl-diphosphatase
VTTPAQPEPAQAAPKCRRGVWAFVPAGLLLVAAAVLTVLVVVRFGPMHLLDRDVALRLNHYISHRRLQLVVWKTITTIGGPSTWRVLGALAAILLWYRRRRRDALLVAAALAGGAALSGALKVLIGRPRPTVPNPVDHAAGGSYPSGHALTSFVAIGLIVILTWHLLTRAKRCLVILAATGGLAAVAFSRLILGVHYLSDVIGAWLIAATWLGVLVPTVHRPRRGHA